MKKFPRLDVIEKQVAVAIDAPPEECVVSKDELGNVTGGNASSVLSRFGRGFGVMYGVGLPVRRAIDSVRNWFSGSGPSNEAPKSE